MSAFLLLAVHFFKLSHVLGTLQNLCTRVLDKDAKVEMTHQSYSILVHFFSPRLVNSKARCVCSHQVQSTLSPYCVVAQFNTFLGKHKFIYSLFLISKPHLRAQYFHHLVILPAGCSSVGAAKPRLVFLLSQTRLTYFNQNCTLNPKL